MQLINRSRARNPLSLVLSHRLILQRQHALLLLYTNCLTIMSVASASVGGGNYAKRPQGYPSRIPGPVPQPIRGQGGHWGVCPLIGCLQAPLTFERPQTMFAGMGVVAAGLLGFYYAQFSIQGKRSPTTVKNLAEIPTCKYPLTSQQRQIAHTSARATAPRSTTTRARSGAAKGCRR